MTLHVFLDIEKKTFFSRQRLSRSGVVSQNREILRAARPAKRLGGRWVGGYFATGAEGLALPSRSSPRTLAPS